MSAMATLKEIVETRLAQMGKSPIEAAGDAGLERTFLLDIVKEKKKSVRSDKIADLARALRLDPDALARNEAVPIEEKPVTKTPKANASFPPRYQRFNGDYSIPLLGRSSGGPNGKFVLNGAEVGRVFCPPELEGVEDAYAVQVWGTSMVPRFRPAETVWLNPHLPVRAEDDVVVQILDDDESGEVSSYIKQFRHLNSKELQLYQHNPEPGEDHILTFPASRVFSIHKVVFAAML